MTWREAWMFCTATTAGHKTAPIAGHIGTYRTVPLFRFIRVSNRLQHNRQYVQRNAGWSKSLCAPDDYSTNHQVRRDFLNTLYISTHSSMCRSFRRCPCFTTYQVNIYHGHSCCTCFMAVGGVINPAEYSRQRCISVLKFPPLNFVWQSVTYVAGNNDALKHYVQNHVQRNQKFWRKVVFNFLSQRIVFQNAELWPVATRIFNPTLFP